MELDRLNAHLDLLQKRERAEEMLASAERVTRLKHEAQEREERRLAREAQEARLREEEEERAKREGAQKPNPVRYVQTPSGIRKEIWSGMEGRYVDAGPAPGHSVFSR